MDLFCNNNKQQQSTLHHDIHYHSNNIIVTIDPLLSNAMDEYNKRGHGSPDPSLGSLEEESSHFSHDSGDADDFDMDLLFYSDDDSDYQPPEDELTLEEEEMLAESAPFT